MAGAASAPGRAGARRRCAALLPYVPGKPIAELERELGIHDIIKLASNENPYGPSPRRARGDACGARQIWLYPDDDAHELKEALARHLRIERECICVGNGSNELLMLLAETFLTRGVERGVFAVRLCDLPHRDRQERRALHRRCRRSRATARCRSGTICAAMAAAIAADTQLVFIANPNNPTGTWAEPAAVKRLIEQRCPRTPWLCSMRPISSSGASAVHRMARPGSLEHPNLVMLRTFSKAYGLGGTARRLRALASRGRRTCSIGCGRRSMSTRSRRPARWRRWPTRRTCVAPSTCTVRELDRVRSGARCARAVVRALGRQFSAGRLGSEARAIYEPLLRRGIIVRPVAGYGLGRVSAHLDRPARAERSTARGAARAR